MIKKEKGVLKILIISVIVIVIIPLIFIVKFVTGWMNFSGGAGGLKSYEYSLPKNELEIAINHVLKNNSKIYRDTIKEDYYNKDGYVTIKISEENVKNEYTFRFYGDQEEWKKSKSSSIFIVYAHDKDGNGGSEGHGGISDELLKEFYKVFELELINKVDKQLKIKHTESE
jgi:hypothetical protein